MGYIHRGKSDGTINVWWHKKVYAVGSYFKYFIFIGYDQSSEMTKINQPNLLVPFFLLHLFLTHIVPICCPRGGHFTFKVGIHYIKFESDLNISLKILFLNHHAWKNMCCFWSRSNVDWSSHISHYYSKPSRMDNYVLFQITILCWLIITHITVIFKTIMDE